MGGGAGRGGATAAAAGYMEISHVARLPASLQKDVVAQDACKKGGECRGGGRVEGTERHKLFMALAATASTAVGCKSSACCAQPTQASHKRLN